MSHLGCSFSDSFRTSRIFRHNIYLPNPLNYSRPRRLLFGQRDNAPACFLQHISDLTRFLPISSAPTCVLGKYLALHVLSQTIFCDPRLLYFRYITHPACSLIYLIFSRKYPALRVLVFLQRHNALRVLPQIYLAPGVLLFSDIFGSSRASLEHTSHSICSHRHYSATYGYLFRIHDAPRVPDRI